jgi:P4 family phage/plasmid primase-like protien
MTGTPVTDYDIDDALPTDLLARRRWFCWKYDEGRKIPRAPWATGGDEWISWKETDYWTDYETAAEYAEKLSGYGFASCIPPQEANCDKRLILFDFDNCRDPDSGAIHPHAWAFLTGEDRDPLHGALSTSGTGIHGYAYASIPDGYKPSWTTDLDPWDEIEGYDTSPFDEPPELECYAADRFIALTGDHITATPTAVPELSETVHEMFGRFGTERTTGTAREPEHNRAEVADTDATGDIEVIFDAIAHSRPGDIRLQSSVTKERADGTVSLDPSWEQSDSGTRLAELDDCWLYRKGNHRLDALQVVALEERIITRADEYPEGEAFWNAVDALRDRGARIPEYQSVDEEPSPTAVEEIRDSEAEPTTETAADGGVATEQPTAATPDLETDPWENAGQRIQTRVATPYDPPEDYDGPTIDKLTAVDRTARIYHEEFSWVRPRADTRGWRATLYNYVPEEGIYEPHGEAEIERMIDKHLGPIADNQFVNEVVAKVERKARIRVKRLGEDAHKLVVDNGILNLRTGELTEHTPAEFHRTRLDVAYDPDAECDQIDSFLHDVVDDADVPRLYRFIAHALYRDYPEAKAAMLLGEGENGKTTFLNLVEEFLGGFNVSHESLRKLNEHQWSPARLNGKLANIDADMSDQSPDSMGMFKRLTGGDPIHGEVKFEQPVKFTNNATMMFACNEMPILHDDTRGNWRRWQLIKFPYTFDEADPDSKDPVPEPELREQLHDDEQLAGLLTKCVEEISAWAEDPERAFFPDADSWETTRSKMRRAAEPVFDFAKVCLQPAEDNTMPKDDLRRVYQRYATLNGLQKMGREEFGKKLLNLPDFNVENARLREGGDRVTAYSGVELTERGRQILNGHEEREHAAQTGLEDATGRQGNVERLKQILRDHEGSMEKEALFARLGERFSVDPEAAESALEKALTDGIVLEPEAGMIRPCW